MHTLLQALRRKLCDFRSGNLSKDLKSISELGANDGDVRF
jgi:hypothetical protein